MSEENGELVRSVLEPLSGINVAELDWGTEAIGEMLGRAYSPDIELRTLEIPLGLDTPLPTRNEDASASLDVVVEILDVILAEGLQPRPQVRDHAVQAVVVVPDYRRA